MAQPPAGFKPAGGLMLWLGSGGARAGWEAAGGTQGFCFYYIEDLLRNGNGTTSRRFKARGRADF
jgi:hypothetical protein